MTDKKQDGAEAKEPFPGYTDLFTWLNTGCAMHINALGHSLMLEAGVDSDQRILAYDKRNYVAMNVGIGIVAESIAKSMLDDSANINNMVNEVVETMYTLVDSHIETMNKAMAAT